MVSKTLSLKKRSTDTGALKTRTGSSRPKECWKSKRFPTNTDHAVAIIPGLLVTG